MFDLNDFYKNKIEAYKDSKAYNPLFSELLADALAKGNFEEIDNLLQKSIQEELNIPVEERNYAPTPLFKDYLVGGKSYDDFEVYVRRLTNEQTIDYELFVYEGKIVNNKGEIVNTNNSIHNAKGFRPEIDDKAIYIMTLEGRILMSKENAVREFHHSTLGQGKSVAAAGEIVIHNGVIIEITPNSGHYRESPFDYIEKELILRGIDVSKIKFTPY